MWISKQIIKSPNQPTVQTGISTLNRNGEVDAVSTGAERNIHIYVPYGYSFSLPTGMDMLLTKGDGEQAAIGVLMKNNGIKAGEVKITAASGAYIHLKNNGSVVINGLEIDRDGVIADE